MKKLLTFLILYTLSACCIIYFGACNKQPDNTPPVEESISTNETDNNDIITELTPFTYTQFGNNYKITGIKDKTITNITIPNFVTEIGNDAFKDCRNLQKVDIKNNVKRIGHYAFFNCFNLTEIAIPDSVIDIGIDAFTNCTNLQYYEYNDCYYLGNKNNNYIVLIRAKSYNITSCNIHENTKFIHDQAFWCCENLIDIIIPTNVRNIGSYAFDRCKNLTTLVLGNNVSEISYHAFDDCQNLKTIMYNGTKKEWQKITKYDDWNNGIPLNCDIYCIDGKIAI